MTFVHGLKGNRCCTQHPSLHPLSFHQRTHLLSRPSGLDIDWGHFTRGQDHCIKGYCSGMLSRNWTNHKGSFSAILAILTLCSTCSWMELMEQSSRIKQLFREGLELKGKRVGSKRACFGLLLQISFCNLAFSRSLLLLHC